MDTPRKANRDWIALLEAANANQGDTIPKGYRSMAEWLREFGIGETTWRRNVVILEEKGVMIRGYYRIYENGRTIKKPFWKKKK